nr:helix-turn-helix transcriptional regulator [Streptomyces aureocirculatus]
MAALTEREREVISLLGGGASNRNISEILCITERTVKAHIARIIEKLSLKSRYEAALIAVLHSDRLCLCTASHPYPHA